MNKRSFYELTVGYLDYLLTHGDDISFYAWVNEYEKLISNDVAENMQHHLEMIADYIEGEVRK